MVYQSLAKLQDLLFPPRCQLCGDGSGSASQLCVPCTAELPWLANTCSQCAQPLAALSQQGHCGACQRRPPAFDETTALFHYQPPVDYLLKRLKFANELACAPLLAGLLAERLGQRGNSLPGLLVPVPLHPTRLHERGFNQALELARVLGKRLHIPLAHRLCRRRRPTEAQSRLPPAARRLNMRNAFAVSGTPDSRHVAIVDDVMTTGHTANELARTLKRAGAECVEVWVIARTGR
jgi:ComF family protein